MGDLREEVGSQIRTLEKFSVGPGILYVKESGDNVRRGTSTD
jgi:hypothetical protein